MNIEIAQKYLKVPVTYELDEFTQAAIRNYQSRYKLKVTGTLTEETEDLLLEQHDSAQLGTLTTDLSEVQITKKLLNPNEYYKGPTKKKTVFLHFTAGGCNPYNVISDWENDNRGKVSTHFVIGGSNAITGDNDYDGKILQCMPDFGNYGWHIGVGNVPLHHESIGIELCNYGPLTKRKDGRFYNIYGKVVNSNLAGVVGALDEPFREYKYYHKLTDRQINQLYFLLRLIADKCDIDLQKGLKEFINSENPNDAFGFKPSVLNYEHKTGVFTHCHVSPKNKFGRFEKWDLFPQPELINMIKNL